MIKPPILIGLLALLGVASCADPLVGTWTATNVAVANGQADLSMHFDQDDSFEFNATSRHAADAPELPGCHVTVSMQGYRWTDPPSGRVVTIAPASNARITFAVSQCSDPSHNVAPSVSMHTTDPAVPIYYAITDLGLFADVALAGWEFHPGQFPRHTMP